MTKKTFADRIMGNDVHPLIRVSLAIGIAGLISSGLYTVFKSDGTNSQHSFE